MKKELKDLLEELIAILQEVYPEKTTSRIRQIVIEDYLDRDLVANKDVRPK